MENIFTFDEEEIQEEPFDDLKEDNLQSQSPHTLFHKPYVFDDFDGEDAEVSNFEELPGKENEDEKCSTKHKRQSVLTKKKPKQESEAKARKSLNLHPESMKVQNKQNMGVLKGVEVQDLNIREMEYVCEKKAIKVTDLRKFLNTPLGDYKVKAILKKESGGFFNTRTKFTVHIEQNNKFLMTILRDGFSDYIFSLSKESVSTKNKNYLGMMTGNLSGTQFSLFDSGFSPKETRALEQCRKQLASIRYEESKGPRKFQVLVSTNGSGFHALEPEQDILTEMWAKKERNFMSKLYSKSPEFDLQEGNYKMDFKGVVKKASVKNFILGGTEWEDSLIFGRLDDTTFVMEIKEPFSVIQAAAICISSIQYKLHWG